MTLTAAAFRPSTDPFGVHLLRSPLTPTRSLRGIGKYCEAFRKEGRAIGGRKWFLASVNATAHALPAKNYLGNRFVYCVVSQRAGGLSLGVNANPDKHCNFDCVYCEVDRTLPGREGAVDVTVMLEELERLLVQVAAGRLSEIAGVPTTLEFKEVALSGDGEPTLSANFREVVEAVVGLRARRHFPFKIVVITNGTGLHLPSVRLGLSSLSARDDVWIKLDAGSPAAYRRINRSETPFDLLLRNIRDLGRRRSIVIQSLFPLYDGEGPAEAEIEAYVRCLRNLRSAGASIALVQVYSAHRAAADGRCGHLSLRVLSGIARRIREGTGLPAEVF